MHINNVENDYKQDIVQNLRNTIVSVSQYRSGSLVVCIVPIDRVECARLIQDEYAEYITYCKLIETDDGFSVEFEDSMKALKFYESVR